MMPSRSGATPVIANKRATLAARAAESSQLDGYCAVLIGTLSVKPSTRNALGKRARMPARFSSTALAEVESCATPLGNRMSVRISISSQFGVWRTTTSLRSISGCSALRTWFSMSCMLCAPPRPGAGGRCSGNGSVTGLLRLTEWRIGTAAAGWRWPSDAGGGAMTWLLPLKACSSDSDITRNLPSLTTDTAYITTKKASSRVIRSA